MRAEFAENTAELFADYEEYFEDRFGEAESTLEELEKAMNETQDAEDLFYNRHASFDAKGFLRKWPLTDEEKQQYEELKKASLKASKAYYAAVK